MYTGGVCTSVCSWCILCASCAGWSQPVQIARELLGIQIDGSCQVCEGQLVMAKGAVCCSPLLEQDAGWLVHIDGL